jgi:aspartyl-tRNA(Asn)/glutamyl-tRNA(Gln) amidotransferase subunit B
MIDILNVYVSQSAVVVIVFYYLHRVAVQQAIRAASAFNCQINKTSYFERKHYFYQDLPLGYQVCFNF